MLTGKTFSIYTILERLFRNSAFVKDLNLADAVEYAGEAIDLIGAPTALLDKITDGNSDVGNPPPITIVDYKGLLPFDLKEIIQTRDYESKKYMRYSFDTFHGAMHCEGSPDLLCNSDLTYKLGKGMIRTSFKEGKVEMAYRAYHLDEHGMPLIPAEERYMKAIEAYIKYKLYRPLWELGKIRDAVYHSTEQEYLFYMGSAENHAKLIGMDQGIGIKNMMLRLIPDVMQPEIFFSGEGRYGEVNIHNNIGL